MTVSLWFLQGFLCAIFLMVGCAKVLLPKDKLHQAMPIYSNVPLKWVRVLGIFEILAAAGILLPSLLGIAPYMTSVTATVLAVAMAAAAAVHAGRKEYKQLSLPTLLLLAAVAVVLLRH
jgi:uncharacterized membrane protein